MDKECLLPTLLQRQAAKYGDKEAVAFVNENGEKLQAYSYSALLEAAQSAACALARLGVGPGDVTLTYASNCPQMLIADFACYLNGAIPVSIYATASAEQVAYILDNCKPKVVYVGDESQRKVIDGLRDKAASIIAVCDWSKGETLSIADADPDEADRLMALVQERSRQVKADDTATLIYTSGTTGEPKAADLTHGAFNAVYRMHRARLPMLSDADRSLCFLPLCHIFEKAWTYFCLAMGIHVDINQNPKEIAKTMRSIRPTCMCSVPRFWEKAYAAINEKMKKMPVPKRAMARLALMIGRARNLRYARLGKKAPWWIERAYAWCDKAVLGHVKRAMGIDHGNLFPTAGAPIADNIVAFFRSIGVDMVVGYGLSETTATVTCYPQTGYVIGSVGTAMPEVEVRIGLMGEIEVKGPTVMRGYYRNDKATVEAFTKDGWLRTGDAGFIDPVGAIVLTERLKDLFKTSNGKYVAPQAIESRLGADRYIEQVAVVGESRKYVTAIIIPAYEALKEYARSKKIAFKSIEDLIKNSEIVKMIQHRIDKLQKGLPSFEQIKKFTLLPNAFTIEKGELTNTLKIRRPVIASHYAKEIDAMY